MISRAQRLLFALMLLAVVVMGAFLIRLREHAQDRLTAPVTADEPSSAGVDSSPETIRLLVAHDLDGSLVEVDRSYPMPQEPNERARVVLDKLLAEYAAPKSPHLLTDAAGLEQVYLMAAPGQTGKLLAVVDLTAAFAESHPSGIAPETLTLLSIISTLHANNPAIGEVRFLVDGQQRPTLAGHADLTRVYLASDAETGAAER